MMRKIVSIITGLLIAALLLSFVIFGTESGQDTRTAEAVPTSSSPPIYTLPAGAASSFFSIAPRTLPPLPTPTLTDRPTLTPAPATKIVVTEVPGPTKTVYATVYKTVEASASPTVFEITRTIIISPAPQETKTIYEPSPKQKQEQRKRARQFGVMGFALGLAFSFFVIIFFYYSGYKQKEKEEIKNLRSLQSEL